MTDETKRIFSSPWVVKHYVHARWEVDFEVSTTDGMLVAVSPTEKQANRLARLPELYDALVHAVRMLKDECSANISHDCEKDGCPYAIVPCPIMEWRELLKKVRDGE